MKVKIGNVIYDSSIIPIMLIMTEKDKLNIANMDSKSSKFLSYPSEIMTEDEAREFMVFENEINNAT